MCENQTDQLKHKKVWHVNVCTMYILLDFNVKLHKI